jgi:hypothetical protein
MNKKLKTWLAALLLLVATPWLAHAADNVVIQWNNAALEAIRVGHPGPPQAARANAMVHTAMYDAWAAYDPVAVGTRLGGTLRRPDTEMTDANKAKAMSYAAYRALSDLYPAEQYIFDDLMLSLGYDKDNATTDTSDPAGVGNVAAAAVLEFRHADGSNQLDNYADTTGYVPVNGPDTINDPNRWQPLRVSDGHGGFVIQKFIAPHWYTVTPFALLSADQFRPTRIQYYPSAGYDKQADQVLHYSAALNDKQKVIAEFWADGPSSELPPGHWCLFGQFVSHRDGHSIDQDAKMFFALTNAIFDASIVAWDAKRAYDYVRPVTAINYLYAGKMVRAWAGPYQGTGLIRGEDWRPYQAVTVVTPPFAEYISGHSTFSAAGAAVLQAFTGSNKFGGTYTQPAGTSRVEPGLVPKKDLTLKWETFTQAAGEAGISRRYGGIHFEDGDLEGRKAGALTGAQAWAKAVTYFDGTAQ